MNTGCREGPGQLGTDVPTKSSTTQGEKRAAEPSKEHKDEGNKKNRSKYVQCYRETQYYCKMVAKFQTEMGWCGGRRIEYYAGDMESGQFEEATQLTDTMMIKPYGKKKTVEGVIVCQTKKPHDEHKCEFFPVEKERIKCCVNVLVGRKETCAQRYTGPIQFAGFSIKHVYLCYFNDKSWYPADDVKEVSHMRERKQPLRDLGKSAETEKLRKELSYQMTDKSREFVKNSCRSFGVMSDEPQPITNSRVMRYLNDGEDFKAWLLISEHYEQTIRQKNRGDVAEDDHQIDAVYEVVDVDDEVHQVVDIDDEVNQVVDIDQLDVDELAEKAKSQWVTVDNDHKIAEARNFLLSMMFLKLSGKIEGATIPELKSLGCNDLISLAAVVQEHNKHTHAKRSKKKCRAEGCTKKAQHATGGEYCLTHSSTRKGTKCKCCNKNVRRNGLCSSCGDAATRNEPYYCSQCNIRLVRIKNNRCASCSDRRCVECKIGWIEHAGRLCTKCYLAKGGTRKLCKLCNKNVPKCAGQLCRSCFSRTKNNM